MEPADPPETVSPLNFLPADPGGTFDSVCGPRPAVGSAEDSSAATHGPGSWIGHSIGDPTSPQLPAATAPPPYVVVRRVGRGGFGEVWEAVQTALNRRVAIKQFHLKAEDEAEARELEELFRHEAFTTAALDHPNIVPVYDFGTDESGRPMLAMKLVRGENWDTAIRRDLAAMSPADLLARHLPILADVTQAVVFAHDAGVIHRDIKPAQVMLGPYGEVLLMDWGLAVLVDAAHGTSPLSAYERERIAPRAAHASSPAGTPAYMAPEQTEDDGSRIGPWTDVYLLGGILYLLLTGSRPHESATAAHAFELARSGVIIPPAERAPDRTLPADLVDLAGRALEPDPIQRTLTAREFHQAILEHLSGASRRRESMALAAQAIRLADPMPEDYAALSDVINLLDRARLLWPENPAVEGYWERCLVAQSRMGIAQGDLLLARTTISRLTTEQTRASLLRELEAAAAARSRKERERKTLRLATAGLTLVVLVGGAALLSNLESERAAAQDARTRAEGLLGFMLGDLRQKLEPVGRVEVLESVAQRAMDYLDSVPTSQQDLPARIQRIRTAVQVAAIESARGNQSKGLGLLKSQLPLVQQFLADHPGDPDVIAAAAELHASMGRIFTEQGTLGPAGDSKSEARRHYAKLLERQPWERRWAREYASVTRDIGDDANLRGEFDAGFAAYEDVLALMAGWQSREPSEREWRHTAAVTLLHYGLALGSSGRPEDRLTRAEQGLALTNQMVAADPKDFSARSTRGMLLFMKGSALISLGRNEQGIDTLSTSVAELREVSASDPANLDWYTDYLQALAEEGRALMGAGRQEEGRQKLEQCLKLLEVEIAKRPDNALWRRDLATVCQELSRYHDSGGRKYESTVLLARGIEALLPIWEHDQSVRAYGQMIEEMRGRLRDRCRDIVFAGKSARIIEPLRVWFEVSRLLSKLDPANTANLATLEEAQTIYAVPLAQSGRYAETLVVIKDLDTLLCAGAAYQAGDPVAVANRQLLLGILNAANEEAAGRFDRAAQHYESASDGYSKYGDALPSQRSLQKALAALQIAKAASLRFMIDDIERGRRDLAAAEEFLEVANQPAEGELDSRIFLFRAQLAVTGARSRLLRASGDTAAAREQLERIVALCEPYRESGDAKVIEALAFALKSLGRLEEAQQLIDQLSQEGSLSELSRRGFDRIGQ